MKNKKVLFVATVVKKHINVFHLPYLQWFQHQGYQTHVAARDDFNGEECSIPHCDKHFNVQFERSPLNKSNIQSYIQLKRIINENNYEIIHCHTPVAAILTRFAARKVRKQGTKIIYTAHGFHFFKGAPLLNWLVYFPLEYLCSFLTDVLITINQEDYNIAKNFMKSKQIKFVPGVGVDIKKIKTIKVDKEKKRKELGIPERAIVLLSVGELSKRKNHQVIIESLGLLKNENIHYCIAGEGGLQEILKNKAKNLQIEKNVHFLGFRRDITELCKISDIFVFPSLQEGLPVSLMEAMATGLPIVCSEIRGNIELVDNYKGGYRIPPYNYQMFSKSIAYLSENQELCSKMAVYNSKKVERFDIAIVNKLMIELYNELIT